MEDPIFQPHLFDGHLNPAIGSFIDPSLQASPSDPYLSQWEREPPQVKRWISDDQRTAYFNAVPYSNVVTYVARPPGEARPVPLPSQVRFASPISSSDRGLTAPSPLAETESFYDNNNNLPSTPSDTAVLSPSYHPGHVEYYSSQEQAIQFVNMGPAAPPAYVNPGDVDPSQQLGYCDAEAAQPRFSLEDRSYSFGSGTSYDDIDLARNQITVAFAHQRMSSPEETRPVIKVERGASAQYPPPPGQDDDGDAFKVPEQKPFSKRKKDDQDPDYTTGKKIKPSGSTSPRKTRPKPAPPRSSLPRTNPTTSSSSISSSRVSQNLPKKPATSSSVATKAKAFTCGQCKHSTTFKDQATLDNHVKKTHTRPFKCVFHFAGCTSTFAAKNEWKRHNATQHLVENYWLCTEGQCGKTGSGGSSAAASSSSSSGPKPRNQQSGPSTLYDNTFDKPPASTASSKPPPPVPTAGVRFNRKDLYTQHVRRMHMPPNVKKDISLFTQQQKTHPPQQRGHQAASGKRKAAAAAAAAASTLPPQTREEKTKQTWETQLRQRQQAACRGRIAMPKHMRCPAEGCGAEFTGGDAWDARMEHVAKHLETGDRGEVSFGGPGDAGLVEWAASPEVGVIVREGEGWKLVEVKKGGGARKGRKDEDEDEDEDEGEEEEEEEEGEGDEIVVDDGERDAEGEEDDEV